MNPEPAVGGRLGPLVYLADNWISRIGILLVTTAGVAWLFTIPVHLGGGEPHPYLGLLTVFLLPLVFFLGLALIPLGIRLKERRQRSSGDYPASFPAARWSNPEFRKLLSVVLIATAANVVIGGHLTYSAVEYMDSVSFCGQACHIMTPEFTAYAAAPHSEVACVDCHIGAGPQSYIAAKLNGTKQLIEVITGTYPTPVPTPVHNLAQGSLTCSRCHANRDFGVKAWQRLHFESDEQNSAKRTQLTLFIGGGENRRRPRGAPVGDAIVEYRADPIAKTSIGCASQCRRGGEDLRPRR
jgi:nitrate/TMAO reductase-like tetraheme cytochrome c subunit